MCFAMLEIRMFEGWKKPDSGTKKIKKIKKYCVIFTPAKPFKINPVSLER